MQVLVRTLQLVLTCDFCGEVVDAVELEYPATGDYDDKATKDQVSKEDWQVEFGKDKCPACCEVEGS